MLRVLAVALLLAGCLAPADPPSPTTPARTPPTPPSPDAHYVEVKEGWTLDIARGSFAAREGEPIRFDLTVSHARMPPEVWLEIPGAWAGLVGETTREGDGLRASGIVFVGRDERLAVAVTSGEERVVFDGPPIVVRGEPEVLPTELHDDVVEVAPGLSIETSPGHVRVVFASARVQRTTADESVRSDGPFALDVGPDGARLVGFVRRVSSDAVAPLDEEARSRVIVEADVAPGPLRVAVVTRLDCFCLPRAPSIEERVVEVP